MSPKNICQPKVIELYSSENFPVESIPSTATIAGWNATKDRLKLIIKFVSKYVPPAQVGALGNAAVPESDVVYFKSTVCLDAVYNAETLTVDKKYVTVRNICFKNELNVTQTSQTDDYYYLYDISCRSADNKFSFGFDTNESTLADKEVENAIATAVRNFVKSSAFAINWDSDTNVASVTLDVSQQDPVIFSTVKNCIKYKFVNICAPTESFFHKLVKAILICAAISAIVMIVKEICNKHSQGYDSQSNNVIAILLEKVKGLFNKSSTYGVEPQPYTQPEPVEN